MRERQKYAYILVGLAGTGKSSYRKHLMRFHRAQGFVAVCSDDYIEGMAKKSKKTYDEVFEAHRDAARVHAFRQFKQAINNRLSVIIDNMNITKEHRKKYLSELPDDYHVVAVVFPIPKNHKKWLVSRPGKTIPVDKLERWKEEFEPPLTSEGINEIRVWQDEIDLEKRNVRVFGKISQ